MGFMLKRLLPILCVLATSPVWAEEARPRLVVGGMNLSQPDLRAELYATKGGFSAGAASDGVSAERGRMALGGYAAYAFQDVKLSSSLKGAGDTSVADFSAAYTGFGADSTAAFRLGYEWGNTSAFSVNPAQAGLSAFSGAYDPNRPVGDLSMTLSFTHDFTPSFSAGGFAAAIRKDDERSQPENSLSIGAGLGYKF